MVIKIVERNKYYIRLLGLHSGLMEYRLGLGTLCISRKHRVN